MDIRKYDCVSTESRFGSFVTFSISGCGSLTPVMGNGGGSNWSHFCVFAAVKTRYKSLLNIYCRYWHDQFFKSDIRQYTYSVIQGTSNFCSTTIINTVTVHSHNKAYIGT